MTEQTDTMVKKQKPVLLRRVFWWLWVILLSALLVLGLIFAAPWKAITLTAIFLAAATILPRTYRKWFLAAAGLAVIAFVIWVLAPTNNEGWEPYKYDLSSQLAKLEQQRAVPLADNAALAYMALLEEDSAEDVNLSPGQFYETFRSPWKSSDYPEASKLLEKHSQTIQKLLDISKMPECRFPLNNPGEESNTIPYGTVRRLSSLLASAGNNDAGEGRYEQALEKYSALALMGRQMIKSGTAIDMLVGIAIKARAYNSVRTLIMNALDEEYFSRVQNTICAPDDYWESSCFLMLEYDKLTSASELAKYYEVNKNGRIRLSRDPYWCLREALKASQSPDANEQLPDYRQWLKATIHNIAWPSWSYIKLMKAWTIIRWLYLPSKPEDALAYFNSCFDGCIFAADGVPQLDSTKFSLPRSFNRKKGILAMARVQDYRYQSMSRIRKRSLADRNCTLLFVALKRFKDANGKWPENLDEVNSFAEADAFVDPVNDGAFVYKLIENGFTFYSKGPNGIDDQGKREKFPFPGDKEVLNKGCDDWVIWPMAKKANTEQEITNAEQ